MQERHPDGLGHSDADEPRAKSHDISVLVLSASVVKLDVDVLERPVPSKKLLHVKEQIRKSLDQHARYILDLGSAPTLEIVIHIIVIVVAES